MKKNLHFLKKYISSRYLFYTLLKVLILLFAILVWLFNRGNAYQHFFAFDEFIPADHAVTDHEIVSTNSDLSEEGSFMKTLPITLQKGSYLVTIEYTVDSAGNYVSASTSQLSSLEFHAPDIHLSPVNVTASVTIELSRRVTDFTLEEFF